MTAVTVRRVLLVAPKDSDNGAQRSLAVLRSMLTTAGVETDVLLLDPSRTDGFLHRSGPVVSVEPARTVAGTRWRQVRTVRRLAASGRYGAVVSFLHRANWLVAPAAWRTSPLVVIAERNAPFTAQRRRWNRTHLPWCRLADVAVVQTADLAAEIAGRWSWPRRVVVIPNALDAMVAADHVPMADRDRVVLAAGRLHADKGFDVLLDAVAAAGEALAGWQVQIVGSGPEAEALTARRDRLGLTDRVEFVAHDTELHARMRRSSVFVLSSRSEGFANVVIEAMASGCAVIAADCAYGPRSILTDGTNGVLVPVDDPEALAVALATLTGDAGLRARLAASAVVDVRAYDVDHVSRLWLELLDAEPGAIGVDA